MRSAQPQCRPSQSRRWPVQTKTESGIGKGSHGRRATADNHRGAIVRGDGRATIVAAPAATSKTTSQTSGGRRPTYAAWSSASTKLNAPNDTHIASAATVSAIAGVVAAKESRPVIAPGDAITRLSAAPRRHQCVHSVPRLPWRVPDPGDESPAPLGHQSGDGEPSAGPSGPYRLKRGARFQSASRTTTPARVPRPGPRMAGADAREYRETGH